MTIIDLAGDLFADTFGGETMRRWRVFLRALHGLPMDADDLEIYRHHTGRSDPPTRPPREAWVVVGRRGGKSLIAGLLAVYAAAMRDYRSHLAPGETAVVMCLASDRRQAAIVRRYVGGLLRSVPMLSREIAGETRETLELRSGTTIEVRTSTHHSVRGFTAPLVIADEIAHWYTAESERSDTETVRALRPTLATIPGAQLVCISTPYARKGALWDAYSRHFGQDGDVLVWRGTSAEMNPTLAPSIVEEALEEDEAAARAEYLAEFRSDVEQFLSHDSLRAVTIRDRLELPYSPEFKYTAFCDPSGGSGRDSFTLAIAHTEGESTILDCIREIRPPFSPERAVAEFAATLREYRCHSVVGDRFGGSWVEERFRRVGITYELSPMTRSELYLALLPEIMSRRVELLDHSRLLSQLRGLERRTSRVGRDIVDHPRNSHDDLANAVAGSLVLCGEGEESILTVGRLRGV